jgi:hypothetical protein
MSFLSSIGKSLGGLIKQVAPMAIKAIAGPASSLLKGVVGDLFTKGGAALTKLAGRLPGPFAGLAQKLLGAALPKLQSLANGGIDSLIQKLASSITERFAPGAGNVTTGALPGRAAEIVANNPVAAATSAATAATSAAATGTTSGVNSSNPAPAGSDLPPSPLTGKDAEDIGKQNDFNAKMQSYQARLSAMNKYWEMISNIYKAHDQTKSALVSNLR